MGWALYGWIRRGGVIAASMMSNCVSVVGGRRSRWYSRPCGDRRSSNRNKLRVSRSLYLLVGVNVTSRGDWTRLRKKNGWCDCGMGGARSEFESVPSYDCKLLSNDFIFDQQLLSYHPLRTLIRPILAQQGETLREVDITPPLAILPSQTPLDPFPPPKQSRQSLLPKVVPIPPSLSLFSLPRPLLHPSIDPQKTTRQLPTSQSWVPYQCSLSSSLTLWNSALSSNTISGTTFETCQPLQIERTLVGTGSPCADVGISSTKQVVVSPPSSSSSRATSPVS